MNCNANANFSVPNKLSYMHLLWQCISYIGTWVFLKNKNNFVPFFFLTGKYSCLKVELIFKREFSYYMLTIYVPCCMLVIVSWVSFWLDQNAIPARVSLGVTTLLTMSTQTSGINAQLPPVSYTKAIDVWTGVRTFKFFLIIFNTYTF